MADALLLSMMYSVSNRFTPAPRVLSAVGVVAAAFIIVVIAATSQYIPNISASANIPKTRNLFFFIEKLLCGFHPACGRGVTAFPQSKMYVRRKRGATPLFH
jgi:hypothetical protein